MQSMQNQKTSMLTRIVAIISLTGGSFASNLAWADGDNDILSGPLTWPTELDLVSYRDNSAGAYQAALAARKYTVILFETADCVFCRNLATNLGDERLAKYASLAVVSVTNGDRDHGARQLEEAISVFRYPTMVVLFTNTENITVVGRIEGEATVAEIDQILSRATQNPIE